VARGLRESVVPTDLADGRRPKESAMRSSEGERTFSAGVEESVAFTCKKQSLRLQNLPPSMCRANGGIIMKTKYFAVAVAAAALNLAGCATVINGTKTDYTTETNPAGATVRFSSGQECTTPCSFELKRKSDQRADITLAGFKPTYVLIQSKLGGSAFGNIILGGVVGGVVDGTNGASNRLYPRPLIVKLAPEGSNEEAVLLDKDGKVKMTVKEHNDSVRVDVAKTIGAKLAGLEE
jgi:hypothetical protein